MDFLELALSRRSVRAFEEKPIPKELLEKLLLAGQSAPSAANLQPWHFYMLTDKEMLEKLFTQSLYSQPTWHTQATAGIVITMDPEISGQRFQERGENLYAIQDSASATQNILLCAHSLGLGACWIGAFHEDKCAEIIGAPAHRIPVAIIALGYPARIPAATPRRPLEESSTWIGS